MTLRLLGCNTRHDMQYILPSSGEIAAIIVGDYAADEYTYDVLVHDKQYGLKHVSYLHPSYMALQYPLLFPYGEHGFHLGIRYSDIGVNDGTSRKYVMMLEFVRRHMHSIGKRVILPASFTGGRRYQVMNYQDAMAICRVYGPPDLFVTFTCNTKWREIADALRFEPGQ